MKIITEPWYTKNMDSAKVIESQVTKLENNSLRLLELEYLFLSLL